MLSKCCIPKWALCVLSLLIVWNLSSKPTTQFDSFMQSHNAKWAPTQIWQPYWKMCGCLDIVITTKATDKTVSLPLAKIFIYLPTLLPHLLLILLQIQHHLSPSSPTLSVHSLPSSNSSSPLPLGTPTALSPSQQSPAPLSFLSSTNNYLEF